ncbi:MAG TPA: sigma factor, partial [Actinomycetota bacterium]
MSDQTWVVQQGPPEQHDAVMPLSSFEDFYQGERDALFGALALITGSRFEAEEIAQDAFLAVWQRWDRVAGMESPAGYLYRTAM